MADDIRIGEVAAAAELALHFGEERQVEIDPLVVRAVERPHRRLRRAAAGAVDIAEQHQLRRDIAAIGLLRQHLRPDVLVLRQHGRDEAAHLVLRRTGRFALLLRRGRAAADAADQLGAADQQARIDAERPAEKAEDHHRADADAAAAAGSPQIRRRRRAGPRRSRTGDNLPNACANPCCSAANLSEAAVELKSRRAGARSPGAQ